jgi:hypothetical protein
MGRTALIGHTGFVGGTLTRAAPWSALFNSSTIAEIRGQSFDLLVCAGVSARKWWANKEPEADKAGIARLTEALGQSQIGELVLISTIDVYPDPCSGGDESTSIDERANHPYGRNRAELERWALERFETVRIVRLPALFGQGLAKNAIFDLMHDNMIDHINPAGVFQWYPVARLWGDIGTARANDLRLVNLFTEPLRMSRIIEVLFPAVRLGPEKHPAPTYDVQTRHGRLFGGSGRYIMNADAVIAALSAFVAAERAR